MPRREFLTTIAGGAAFALTGGVLNPLYVQTEG